MNFLDHLVCSQTCVWYRTRSTHNLSQNEHTKLELCPNNRPKSINNFRPMLSHFARWFLRFRAKCKILAEASFANHVDELRPLILQISCKMWNCFSRHALRVMCGADCSSLLRTAVLAAHSKQPTLFPRGGLVKLVCVPDRHGSA